MSRGVRPSINYLPESSDESYPGPFLHRTLFPEETPSNVGVIAKKVVIVFRKDGTL